FSSRWGRLDRPEWPVEKTHETAEDPRFDPRRPPGGRLHRLEARFRRRVLRLLLLELEPARALVRQRDLRPRLAARRLPRGLESVLRRTLGLHGRRLVLGFRLRLGRGPVSLRDLGPGPRLRVGLGSGV